jgi:hypothetical protein
MMLAQSLYPPLVLPKITSDKGAALDVATLNFFSEERRLSDHQLRFKGPGFEFDAKGWMAILAAIVIVCLVLWLRR